VAPVTTTDMGIREVSEQTGLSIDTLRWYEREGLIPLVQRSGLLERQTAAIEQRLAELTEDLAVVRAKAADYRRLIALGLDCEDELAARVAVA
jgi:predicted site-specific integrase-resolvase